MVDERETTISELERLRGRIAGFEQEIADQIARVRTCIADRAGQKAEEQRIDRLLRPQLHAMKLEAEKLEAFISMMDDAFPSLRT